MPCSQRQWLQQQKCQVMMRLQAAVLLMWKQQQVLLVQQ
jgi:hypothetical protein